jgi:hypothetical protein
MSQHSTDEWISEQAEKCLARMDVGLRRAVDSLISDARFVTYDDHATLLLALVETCRTREEALSLLKGAVRCIEDGDLPVGRRVRLVDQIGSCGGESYSSGMAMSDVLNPEYVDRDWQFLWSRLGDRGFCGEHWNRYVAVFMQEVVGSGSTDPAARDAARRTLGERGASDVPPERFVVDFVGDE